jgi:hypothetical protein
MSVKTMEQLGVFGEAEFDTLKKDLMGSMRSGIVKTMKSIAYHMNKPRATKDTQVNQRDFMCRTCCVDRAEHTGDV